MLAWLACHETGPDPSVLGQASIGTVVLVLGDALETYICVRTLVSSGTAEGDEFMAALVDHKTANCGGGREGR